MMFIGTETLVTQLVYESSGMQANRTTTKLEEMIKRESHLKGGLGPTPHVLSRGPLVPSCDSDRP
jgi:hypothetical protein